MYESHLPCDYISLSDCVSKSLISNKMYLSTRVRFYNQSEVDCKFHNSRNLII